MIIVSWVETKCVKLTPSNFLSHNIFLTLSQRYQARELPDNDFPGFTQIQANLLAFLILLINQSKMQNV